VPPTPERQLELEAMWEAYADGASAEEVGAAFGDISKQAVLESFHRHGFATRVGAPRPDPVRQLARIEYAVELYDAGTPVIQIAAEMRLSRNRTYELIREGGRTPMRDRRAREAKHAV